MVPAPAPAAGKYEVFIYAVTNDSSNLSITILGKNFFNFLQEIPFQPDVIVNERDVIALNCSNSHVSLNRCATAMPNVMTWKRHFGEFSLRHLPRFFFTVRSSINQNQFERSCRLR